MFFFQCCIRNCKLKTVTKTEEQWPINRMDASNFYAFCIFKKFNEHVWFMKA